jgi:hypothetical protein
MADKKEVTFDDCYYNNKYEKLGVTPQELYLRQNGACYLTMVYDTVDNKRIFGDLYCTDGTEYAKTRDMLNPTLECAQCMADFLKQVVETNEMERTLDKTIVTILTGIGEQPVTDMYMSRETFDYLEEHIDNTILFSPETNPLKITASGDLTLFAINVIFDKHIPHNTVIMEPGTRVIKV